MRTTGRLGHARRGLQIRYVARGHRRAAVTVNHSLIELNVSLSGCFVDEFLRQLDIPAAAVHGSDTRGFDEWRNTENLVFQRLRRFYSHGIS